VMFPLLQCPELVALPSQQGSVSAAPKAHLRIRTWVAHKLCPLSSSQDSTFKESHTHYLRLELLGPEVNTTQTQSSDPSYILTKLCDNSEKISSSATLSGQVSVPSVSFAEITSHYFLP